MLNGILDNLYVNLELIFNDLNMIWPTRRGIKRIRACHTTGW